MTHHANHTEWRTDWDARLAAWGARLRARGLDGLAAALLDAAEPLSPLGAQVLYVAQPTLGVFFPGQAVTRWARLLEDPATVARVRARLMAESPAGAPVLDEEGPHDGPAD
ncbi:MAG: hypothetical protein JXN59_15495 [Anaerolineae bacterium]|nr:hypothetical protein [Anaerolineae bacterium]